MPQKLQSINPDLATKIAVLRTNTFKIPDDRSDYSYQENGKTVNVTTRNEYPTSSTGKDVNLFDIYLPEEPLEKQPTIFWVHGGGFIGGSKADNGAHMVDFFNTWSSQGYTIISMNYGLAPENPYHQQMNDVASCIQYVKDNADKLQLTLNNLFLGGDSAGAQIISQFILTQLNSEYNKEINIPQVLTREQMKAAILYCGPYDLNSEGADKGSVLYTELYKYIGWALLNPETNFVDWYNSTSALQGVIKDNIKTSSDFIPTYITDGRLLTFTEQGKALVSKLSSLSIDVDSYFPDSFFIGHEYQFDLAKTEAQTSFEKTKAWVDKYSK